MDRREALQRIALLTGGALSLTTVSAVMGGCSAGSDSSGFSPSTLSDTQNELVTVVSERIIPATDTPGARAANVNQFIDKMLTDWHSDEERQHFMDELSKVDTTSNNMHGSNFLDLTEQQQIEVLSQLEQDAEENPMPQADQSPFFPMMKELTLIGYYTSEIGATEELQWNHVAGRYDGCIDYSEVGRAWSS